MQRISETVVVVAAAAAAGCGNYNTRTSQSRDIISRRRRAARSAVGDDAENAPLHGGLISSRPPSSTLGGQFFFYRAPSYNAFRARYCYDISVRPSVGLSSAGIVSKRIDASSNFLAVSYVRGISLVFEPHRRLKNSKGDASGVRKF